MILTSDINGETFIFYFVLFAVLIISRGWCIQVVYSAIRELGLKKRAGIETEGLARKNLEVEDFSEHREQDKTLGQV
jgi:hypothetical protein